MALLVRANILAICEALYGLQAGHKSSSDMKRSFVMALRFTATPCVVHCLSLTFL
jgi:hypothetical protein